MKLKNDIEKLPRQQRKSSMKVKMDEFVQKKQVMVRHKRDLIDIVAQTLTAT